jgi:hypothetical protein
MPAVVAFFPTEKPGYLPLGNCFVRRRVRLQDLTRHLHGFPGPILAQSWPTFGPPAPLAAQSCLSTTSSCVAFDGLGEFRPKANKIVEMRFPVAKDRDLKWRPR